MRVDIQALSFELTAPLVAHIEHRVTDALRSTSRQVTGVTVRIADINANRGGVDKLCRVAVCLRGLNTAMASAVDADMYAAIDLAAIRLRRVVSERLDRVRRLARRPPKAHAGEQRKRGKQAG